MHKSASPDEIEKTIKVLESASEAPSLKPEELDVIGELISNLCGALEVHRLVAEGIPEKDAANQFMKKVLGSIDR
jgi:hypothetical protein